MARPTNGQKGQSVVKSVQISEIYQSILETQTLLLFQLSLDVKYYCT